MLKNLDFDVQAIIERNAAFVAARTAPRSRAFAPVTHPAAQPTVDAVLTAHGITIINRSKYVARASKAR